MNKDKNWSETAEETNAAAEAADTETALSVVAREYNLTELDDLQSQSWFSGKANTQDEKINLYNATANPEFRINDEINMPIEVKDVSIEVIELVSENTGELQKCPRIVIIDSQYRGHVAVSTGVYNAMKRLFAQVGQPATWDKPLTIIPKQITKGNRKILTFNIAVKK